MWPIPFRPLIPCLTPLPPPKKKTRTKGSRRSNVQISDKRFINPRSYKILITQNIRIKFNKNKIKISISFSRARPFSRDNSKIIIKNYLIRYTQNALRVFIVVYGTQYGAMVLSAHVPEVKVRAREMIAMTGMPNGVAGEVAIIYYKEACHGIINMGLESLLANFYSTSSQF